MDRILQQCESLCKRQQINKYTDLFLYAEISQQCFELPGKMLTSVMPRHHVQSIWVRDWAWNERYKHTYFTKSSTKAQISPLSKYRTVTPRNENTLGEVQPSSMRWSQCLSDWRWHAMTMDDCSYISDISRDTVWWEWILTAGQSMAKIVGKGRGDLRDAMTVEL